MNHPRTASRDVVSVGRRLYDKQLRALLADVMVLGSMVDRSIDRAIDALRRQDHEEARRIIADDVSINEKRFAIEEDVTTLLACQQPLAGDLRTVLAVLNIVSDLERMGDHAAGIAKIVLMHGEEPLLKPLNDLLLMARKVRLMLRDAVHALQDGGVEAANRVAREDDAVDNLYHQVHRELIRHMIADPRAITRATHLLWVAHNLERIADHVTNICERVAFAATGELKEMNVSTVQVRNEELDRTDTHT